MKELLKLERKIFVRHGVFRTSDRNYFRRKVMRYVQGLDKFGSIEKCIRAMIDTRASELNSGTASPYYGYNGEKTYITNDFRDWFEYTSEQYKKLLKTYTNDGQGNKNI